MTTNTPSANGAQVAITFNKARAQFMARLSAPEIPAAALKLGYLIAFKYLNRKTGETFVGQDRLAADLMMSVRQVRRLLGVLRRHGLQIKIGHGEGNASEYRIVNADTHVRIAAPQTGHLATEKPDTHVRPTLLREPNKSLFEQVGEERKQASSKKEKLNGHTFTPDFLALFADHPRKEGKHKAQRAYGKARKTTDHQTIADGHTRAKAHWAAERTDPKYIPYLATWLNDRGWDDPLPSAAERERADLMRLIFPTRRA